MNLLALDTATEACSVALLSGGQLRARHEVVGRGHTERLVPMVQALMAEAGLAYAQLDGYVCGIGPGSFAGVRIGLGFVKGLALAADRPAVGVSSLASLALPALRAGSRQVIAAIDARMDEVYLGAYVADAAGLPQALRDEEVCAPAAAVAVTPGDWVAVGTGWGSYDAALKKALGCQPRAVDAAALPRAEDALRIGHALLAAGQGQSADRLLPRYLRNKVALTLQEQRARRGDTVA